MKHFILLILIFAFNLNLEANKKANTTVIYVNASASLGGTGNNWPNAFKYLQDALLIASGLPGEVEIWVAQGTYYPDESEHLKDANGDRSVSFAMLNNVRILGGFLSNASSRNWVDYPTVLSGNINQNGTDLTYQIIKGNGVNDTAFLEGFIIENSDAYPNSGGGIYNDSSSPTISNCVFRNNEGSIGGAVRNDNNSKPVFTNCLFYENYASFGGNAIYNDNSLLTLINCTLSDNDHTSLTNHESIKSEGSTLRIYNSILWNNGTELANVAGGTGNSYSVTYSIVSGGYTGTGNLNTNPLFINPASENYQISLCSPAYNSGNNPYNTSLLDLNNNERQLYSTIDRGAYEFKTTRIYVKKDATGNNDGSSWTDALNYLQDALGMVSTCGGAADIWVAEGTYTTYEGLGTLTNPREASFKLLNNVQLYGGFLGYETALNQRNYYLYTSILSGDINQDDSSVGITDNSYHVFLNDYTIGTPLTNSAILDGFTILGGNANEPTTSGFSENTGGGMKNNYASPIIRNCQFRKNYAKTGGGGIYSDYSSPIIENSSFYQNKSLEDAGGLLFTNGNITLTNTNFIENIAGHLNTGWSTSSVGGGLQIALSTGSITDCEFTNNEALGVGLGGAARIQSSTLTISQTDFSNNEARAGGGLYITGSFLDIEDCNFESNYAESGPLSSQAVYHGGGIYVHAGEVDINSCTFTDNKTDNFGGAIYFQTTNSEVINSTFTGNKAWYGAGNYGSIVPVGGALYLKNDAIVLVNKSVFKENESQDGGGAIYNYSDDLMVINSLFIDNEALLGASGAIENESSSPDIINCTFVDVNVFPLYTIRNANSSHPKIQNNIIWGNASQAAISDYNSSASTVQNNIIKGGYTGGVSTLNIDPKFKDPLNQDYSLQRCSPGLDFGNNAYNLELEDLAENDRVFIPTNNNSGTIDLGAYEFQGLFSTNCDCPPNFTLNGYQTTSYTYRSSNKITSGSIINPNQNVTYGATNSIELLPGFKTGPHGVFTAELSGCVEN